MLLAGFCRQEHIAIFLFKSPPIQHSKHRLHSSLSWFVSLFPPAFRPKHRTVAPEHVYLWGQHPRPPYRLLPSVQAAGPRGQARPNKAHKLPAAQEQPLSSPHNYSAGPVKRLSPCSITHTLPTILHRGSPGCTTTQLRLCR